jgi:hypothetical protein
MTISGRRTLTLAAGTALLTTLGSAMADDLSRDPRVQRGFEFAAQQHINLDPNVPSEGLGSFLVTLTGCNDCHTWTNYAPGGDPYQRQTKQVNLANYLAGGRLFATPTGNFCSRNITPAPQTNLPAGLTRDQFTYVIRTGCDPLDENFNDPQSCGLLQVMPWPTLSVTLRKSEISAIYDYLSAIPHADPGAAAQCTPDAQGVADNQ